VATGRDDIGAAVRGVGVIATPDGADGMVFLLLEDGAESGNIPMSPRQARELAQRLANAADDANRSVEEWRRQRSIERDPGR
jgi:hypothetical protein